MLEQIQADIMELGLREKSFEQFPYGGLPWSKNILAEKEEKEGTPFLVLHISSKDRWETTRWPLPQWQSLVKRILQETELSICIVGVDSEKEMLRSFIHDMKLDAGNRIELCISMPLQEVCSLISASAGVICHNSGILHLATLLKKQTVCITGSSAKFWRPPYPWVKNITSGECNIACNRYKCPIPFFYAKCIRKLPAVKVWQAVQDHLLEIV
ncbi:MAG: hypothetical protein KQH63_14245 [Desulfobulbaceae bacterium]|nr:hypothetical protein [Desulfobulbaceae bacterium]